MSNIGLREDQMVETHGLNEREEATVKSLTDGVAHSSVCRRDPGETGPLIVTVEGVEYQVSADGRKRKLTK